jgi:hypothetical protein
MAKTSIVDEIEHHPQFCLDLSDPLGAIRMGNSIGRFGDRHPAPALGFNARDRYFHFQRTFDEGLCGCLVSHKPRVRKNSATGGLPPAVSGAGATDIYGGLDPGLCERPARLPRRADRR